MDDGILSACDVCHSRKIRCDRRDPCANCRDANTTCRRDRQRQPRKVREQPLSHLGKAVNEIHARISGLECSMNGLLSKQKGEPNSLENRENYIPSATVKFGKGHGENVDCRQSRTTRKMALARDFTSADMKSKKRSSVVAFGFDDHRSPSSRASNYGYGNEKIPDSAPFFVVSEACMTIERHLQASEDLSENKRAVFCTALDSLGQTLDASRYDLETSSCSDTSSSRSSTASESHTLPSVEMTDWMLRSFTTKEQIYQPFDHHPFISRSTVMKMTRDILNNGDLADTTSVVCVSSFAAYFLEEILLRTKESSGLEDIMQNKLKTFHGIARNGISRMNMLGPASLARLQALICGAINAQNVGDLTTSWSLGTAASNTCLALGLNREGNTFSKTGGDTAREALYCMAFCYIHDKGLAMNLVRPPCLQDAYIEIDFTALPPTHDRIPSIYQVFAKFAKIQSSLIQDKYADRSMISQKVKHKIATRHLVELKETWPLIEKIRAEIEGIVGKEPTYQCLAAEYAYHTLHTALLHWQSGLPTSSYMNDICLTSARAALKVIKQLGDTLRTGPELWSSSVVSFLHCAISRYPFTPFIDLFCHTVSYEHKADRDLMDSCVGFLAMTKEHSPLVAKVHKMCTTLHALATTRTSDLPMNSVHSNRPAKSKTVPHSKPQEQPHDAKNNTHPGQGILDFSHMAAMVHSHAQEQQVQHEAVYYQTDDAVWQAMDNRQPLMQWLDSDFHHVEASWHCT